MEKNIFGSNITVYASVQAFDSHEIVTTTTASQQLPVNFPPALAVTEVRLEQYPNSFSNCTGSFLKFFVVNRVMIEPWM